MAAVEKALSFGTLRSPYVVVISALCLTVFPCAHDCCESLQADRLDQGAHRELRREGRGRSAVRHTASFILKFRNRNCLGI